MRIASIDLILRSAPKGARLEGEVVHSAILPYLNAYAPSRGRLTRYCPASSMARPRSPTIRTLSLAQSKLRAVSSAAARASALGLIAGQPRARLDYPEKNGRFCGRATISQKIVTTAAKAGKPNANHNQNSR